jgi:hypothetical protein
MLVGASRPGSRRGWLGRGRILRCGEPRPSGASRLSRPRLCLCFHDLVYGFHDLAYTRIVAVLCGGRIRLSPAKCCLFSTLQRTKLIVGHKNVTDPVAHQWDYHHETNRQEPAARLPSYCKDPAFYAKGLAALNDASASFDGTVEEWRAPPKGHYEESMLKMLRLCGSNVRAVVALGNDTLESAPGATIVARAAAETASTCYWTMGLARSQEEALRRWATLHADTARWLNSVGKHVQRVGGVTSDRWFDAAKKRQRLVTFLEGKYGLTDAGPPWDLLAFAQAFDLSTTLSLSNRQAV